MSASEALLMHGLGLVFALLAVVTAGAVATARAHFAACLALAATAALAALALLCFGANTGALALALVGVGVVPMLMLGGVLLSARVIRGKSRAPRFVVVAAALVAVAIVWASEDATPLAAHLPAPLGLGAWLAPLIMVAGLACTGLLGYGERGALGRGRGGA